MVKERFDFITRCRACLSGDQEMHYLYGDFDQSLSLSDILKSTTNVEIEEDDGISPYLCENCTTIVVDFFNFKTVYQENEAYIKSLLEGENSNDLILLNTIVASSETNDGTIETEINKHFNVQNSVQLKCKKSDDAVIAEVFENCSLNINGNKELEITGGFVEPHDIVGHSTLSEEKKIDYYEEENVIIIPSVKYSCDQCGDCFLLKTEYQQHMLQKHQKSFFEFGHTSEATIKIPKVSELEKNDNAASSKIKSQSKKYICEHCGAAFKKRSYLDDHAEVHTTEKRHICPICGKAFRRRTVLVKHKRLHTHPRQCICEICGLRFNDKGTLKTHIKLKHTKEKNFLCTFCGQWFSLKSTLDKHIYRHNETRERPFECCVCNQSYRDKSSLKRHVIVKHTDNAKKPYCIYCRKKYTTNTNLLKHIRKHHKSTIKQEVESD